MRRPDWVEEQESSSKASVRQVALGQRRLMSQSIRAMQSAAIVRQLAELPLIHTAKTVASYEPWASEPDATAINNALTERGAKVLVPAGGLEPGWHAIGTELGLNNPEQHHNGRLSPGDLQEAELIIVPALRVDYNGTRLGRGAGWYDKMLQHRAPTAVTIALLFEGEYQPDQLLPQDGHDVPMDYVVTPSGV